MKANRNSRLFSGLRAGFTVFTPRSNNAVSMTNCRVLAKLLHRYWLIYHKTEMEALDRAKVEHYRSRMRLASLEHRPARRAGQLV